MNSGLNDHLSRLEDHIAQSQKRYKSFLKKVERRRKRERDIHPSRMDEAVLIQSFAIGGLVERVLEYALSKLIKP